MIDKNIVAGLVATVVVGTASAGSIAPIDAQSLDKKAQAETMHNIFGNVSQIINSPECTVRPFGA
jgi:hypothetical protein